MTDHTQKTKKRLACGQIVPDCDFVATAASEEELLKQVAAHAREAHGVTEVTPELAAKIKAAIQTT
jgi:predicted small metal-binding protein